MAELESGDPLPFLVTIAPRALLGEATGRTVTFIDWAVMLAGGLGTALWLLPRARAVGLGLFSAFLSVCLVPSVLYVIVFGLCLAGGVQ